MISTDFYNFSFGLMQSPIGRPLGADKPPNTKISSKILEFESNRRDEFHDASQAAKQFDSACNSKIPSQCCPTEYNKWEIPVTPITWGNVDEIKETSDEYAHYFLLGQSLAFSITQVLAHGKLLITSTTSPNTEVFKAEVPSLPLPKPDIEPATAEMKVQSGQELAFLFRIVDAHIEYYAQWDRVNDVMEAVGIALASVIYRAKGLCQNPRPYPKPYDKSPRPTLKPPAHSSWPGGHAFGASAVATLLYHSFSQTMAVDKQKEFKLALEKGARRIAYNRERAGLHWRIDGVNGLKMGGDVMHYWLELGSKSKYGDDGVGSIGDFLPLLKSVLTTIKRTDV